MSNSARPNRPLPPPPPSDNVDVDASEQAIQSLSLDPPEPLDATFSISHPSSQSSARKDDAHIHPFHSTLPSTPPADPLALTPLRAHYLKKTLVNLEISHELSVLTHPGLGAGSLGLLGSPFTLPTVVKEDATREYGVELRQNGLPFMRFLFHQFILPFPFLKAAPDTFWSAKVQPFLSSFLAISPSSPVDQEDPTWTVEEKKEAVERKKLWIKLEKHMALMMGSGMKLVGGEEVVRIGQAELRRLEELSEARRRKLKQMEEDRGTGFEFNVVGVRVVSEKGRVRHKSHEEFLIRTSRHGARDVYVSRRYGDFKRLADELRTQFPDHPLPPPPPKDKTAVASPVVASPTPYYSAYNPLRAIYGPGGPAPTSPEDYTSYAEGSPPASPAPSGPLTREKNRLTLRAYLSSIMALPAVINSPVLRSFLLSGPITLTPAEQADTQRRLEADAVREEGRRRFKLEAERRVEGLREGLSQFKGELLNQRGGLKNVFEVVRRVEKVEDLPKAEHSVLEWGRISLAATVFQLFVASDTASDTLASLKRLHGLMPYFVLKGILKVSNPMAMIRGVLELFLARPFGGQSLIQRMFSSSLTEDVRVLMDDIMAVQEKIDDPVLCQKVEQYVSAPYAIQEIFRRDAATENVELLVVILRSPDMPSLSRPQFQRVFRASRAYKEYRAYQNDLDDSDDDEGPDNDDAWLFEDLSILLKLWTKKKEKEQLLALIFEGVTAELLKDIITIFYTPLAQVYKAASIADSVGDMQNFLNDLIRTVEQVEELSQEDPQRTVQTFIDLVQRHEQAFYSFVHKVHSKGEGLFDSLMSWIELFLNYVRDGLPHPVDLDFILPHSQSERKAIMAEVDAVAHYHYKLKVAHEERVRRRFTKSNDAQSAEEAALVDSVVASLSLDDTTLGDAGEIADEDSEEESEEEEERPPSSAASSVQIQWNDDGSEGSHSQTNLASPPKGRSSVDASRTSVDKVRSAFHSHRKSVDETPPSLPERRKPTPKPAGLKKKKKARVQIEAAQMPELKAIRELRPLFVEIVRPMLTVRPLDASR